MTSHPPTPDTSLLARWLYDSWSLDAIAGDHEAPEDDPAEVRAEVERRLREQIRVLVMALAPAPRITLQVIGECVSAVYSIPLKDLRRARDHTLTIPRGILAIVAQDHGHSYPQIGAYMGGRDHTTIMHHHRKAQAMLAPSGAQTLTPAQQEAHNCMAAVRMQIQIRRLNTTIAHTRRHP